MYPPATSCKPARIPVSTDSHLAWLVFCDDGFIDGEGDSQRIANGFFHQYLFFFLSELTRNNVCGVDLSCCFDDETFALL